MLVFASICPHPPIIIPTIGGQELENVKETIQAMEKLAYQIEEAEPETVIVISPHSPVSFQKMS